ncbi:MAG: TlyA family RNA methyltransferase [Chloroflexi bacterium]|nr:TlyA family RNA methyltransferase [Chloroflexota bacterium]
MPGERSTKKRLDQAMMERGMADSLEMARALIMAARVEVDGRLSVAAGQRVSLEETIALKAGPEYYGRGGIKLAHALDHFQLATSGIVALDVGASTGGFTHCLLQRGAQRVYALDVGYGQLDYRLRQDSRVVVLEKVNARYPFPLDAVADMATVDVSFISLTRVLPSVASHIREGGSIVALVKPQFEARRNEVGRGGVIRDSKVHARVLGRVIAWVVNNGFRLKGLVPSPITGEQGNREFFILVSAHR